MRAPFDSDDLDTLQSLLNDAENGLVLLDDDEVAALKRIQAFLNRPTPHDIDEIVNAKNLRPDETHTVEQTVNALWGAP